MKNITKKIVHYNAQEPVEVYVGFAAFVTPIDHPDSEHVSNTRPVQTSKVLSYDKSTGEFETVNTLYKPASVH